MRFYLSGPRILGIRPGVSFDANDLRRFAAPSAPRAAVQGSFVYVVKGDHGRVKIGVSTDPSSRLASLQTGSPFPLEFAFVGVSPGNGYDIEAAAHAMLGHMRVSGVLNDAGGRRRRGAKRRLPDRSKAVAARRRGPSG
jgi:hypothetical protein